MQEPKTLKEPLSELFNTEGGLQTASAFEKSLNASWRTEEDRRWTSQSQEKAGLAIDRENSLEIKDARENCGEEHLPDPRRILKETTNCKSEVNKTSQIRFDRLCKVKDEYIICGGQRLSECNVGNDFRDINLQGASLNCQENRNRITEPNMLQNIRILNLSQSYIQDKGVVMLFPSNNAWISLENLNLAQNLIGNLGAKVLGCRLNAIVLKRLDLSRNSIGNEGIKTLAEGSHWPVLEALVLNDVSSNDLGANHLAANQSWKNLKELHLLENPLLSNLGPVWLSRNISWKTPKKILLRNSKVGDSIGEFLRHNLSRKNPCCPNRGLIEDEWGSSKLHQQIGQGLVYSSRKELIDFERSKHSKASLIGSDIQCRGGGKNQAKGTNELESHNLLGLIEKINQYKTKIQHDEEIKNELKLYIEMLGKSYSFNSNDSVSEDFKLLFGINTKFLSSDSKLRVLLLTGEAGIGKTLFCKHLQRDILFEWDFVDQNTGERAWLPIFADLSRYKSFNPSSSISISEIITKELSLTEIEIQILQENKLDNLSLLPRLLFILDDSDCILQEQNPMLLRSYDTCAKSNFYAFAAGWEHAKFIIACKSETLSDITRRDLLFEPLNQSMKSALPKTFTEFVLQPFNDIQISSYLKKRVFEKFEVSVEEGSTKSWELVKIYEDLLDSLGFKELARIPLNLSLFVDVFSNPIWETKKLAESLEEEIKNNNPNGNGQKKLTRFQLYQLFTNQATSKAVEKFLSSSNQHSKEQNKEQDNSFLFKETKKIFQSIALRSSDFVFNPETKGTIMQEAKEIALLFSHCPFLQPSSISSLESIMFSNKSFQEYFIAAKMIEEILQDTISYHIKSSEMILNQKLLTKKAESISILKFLIDTVTDQLIPKSDLIKLIQSTKNIPSAGVEKQKGGEPSSSQEFEIENELGQQKHPLSVAAANAITILNASGYDFSSTDFSEVCIAGANLSCGTFQGTNFTGANLNNVDFSGAWLKDTIFARAIMKDVQFGVISELRLDKKIHCIAHSPDGKIVAVGVRSEVIILEKQIMPGSHLLEVQRLKGHVGDVKDCSFSADGTHLITCGQDRAVRIWDIKVGECLNILRGHTESVMRSNMSQDGKQIISIGGDGTVKQWHLSEERWSQKLQIKVEGATDCGFFPDYEQLFFLGNRANGYNLYHNTTGKYIGKGGKNQARNSSFSSDGKQALIARNDETIQVVDSIRGYLLKHLQSSSSNSVYLYVQSTDPSFSLCDTQIISIHDRSLQLQEVAGHTSEKRSFDEFISHYSVNPADNNQIALVTGEKIILIEKLLQKNGSRDFVVKGPPQKALNLTGTNIDHSLGLSDENVKLFHHRGDYKGFGKENIKNWLLNNQSSALKKITEIDLSNRELASQSTLVLSRDTDWINLKTLNLSKNRLNDEDTVKIGRNSTWKYLQELVINSNVIADQGALAIAENTCWRNLRKLHLNSNKISDLGAKAFGLNLIWEMLEELDLSRNEIGEEGAEAIGQNSTWAHLKKLDLSSNKIGDNGTNSVASNVIWNCLEELNLSNNKIGDKGATEIGSNTTWTNLKSLSLESNHISDLGASAIVSNDKWVNLEELYLYCNMMRENEWKKMNPNQNWIKMKTMICKIESQRVQDLFEKSAQDLRAISLGAGGIRDYGALVIGRSTQWSHLEDLWLSLNQVGDQGAVALSKNTTWSSLRTLVLFENRIGDQGAISIGSNTTWINLRRLSLQGNEIGNKGAVGIGKNTSWSRLYELYLYSNRIGDEGAGAIGSNTTWINLGVLLLQTNKIGDEGAILLSRNEIWSELRRLEIGNNPGIKVAGQQALKKNLFFGSFVKV